MKKTKHYFLSANTNEGFWNYFDYVVTEPQNEFIYILKGGSGTGKSTLMKRVGRFFEDIGETVEYFHCSSDVQSLDGVHIVTRNVAIVDGTAPHVREANIAGVSEKIINLGEYIDDNIRTKRKELERLLEKKKGYYFMANSLLEVAGKLYKINAEIEEKYIRNSSNIDIFNKLLAKMPIESTKDMEKGHIRHLFDKVIGEKKEETFQDDNEYLKKIKIKANIKQASHIFEMFAKHCVDLGRDVICFHDYLYPQLVSSICIVDENISIVRENKNGCMSKCPHLDMFINNEFMIDSLLIEIGKCLGLAKNIHFKIEKIYAEFVNFESLPYEASKIISDIKTNF